tara:strand:+ start:579 stop:734 length:156 start_codon:yes stop_codon:yes gene_type:complete
VACGVNLWEGRLRTTPKKITYLDKVGCIHPYRDNIHPYIGNIPPLSNMSTK